MIWHIPAKTFLLGEYAALAGGSAIVLTTTPCFELSLTSDEAIDKIHPLSPAGTFWAHQFHPEQNLAWYDPYGGRGGLGASSAQFLGAYLAHCHLLKIKPDCKQMLLAYYHCAWSGEGVKPSGYDVLAQSQHRCVYINQQHNILQSYGWPFKDIAFLLLHSGQKLATHEHLKFIVPPQSLDCLSATVNQAKLAFEQSNSQHLIQAINTYQHQLTELNLVAPRSLELIDSLRQRSSVLAAKGCGAMGADVLLLIVSFEYLKVIKTQFSAEGWVILASNEELFLSSKLISCNK